MGNAQSTERRIFASMLKSLLIARGVKVTTRQIDRFLEFVEQICPWFPKNGTINIETWNKVGDKIQGYYAVHGPEKVSIDAFTLWTLVKECLRGDTGDEKWVRETHYDKKPLFRSRSLGQLPSAPPPSPPKYEEPINPQQKSFLLKSNSIKQMSERHASQNNVDDLNPDDLDKLEQDAAEYHHEELAFPVIKNIEIQTENCAPTVLPAFRAGTMPPPPGPEDLLMQRSPLQLALKEAKQNGEDLDGFPKIFPVIQRQDGMGHIFNDYEAIPYKQLKELKVATTQYGPTAPFTIAIIETIASNMLPPGDWKTLTKAVLSGGDYLLWSTEYADRCHNTAQRPQVMQSGITYEQLAGIGQFSSVYQQLNLNPLAYDLIREMGIAAWKKLPRSGIRKEELTKIRQGPDEPYQDFVSRLLQASAKLIDDTDAALVLVKELAFENANNVCQAAIRPWKGKATLNDYIRLCADIGSSYVQGIVSAAAMKGMPVEQVMAAIKGKRGRVPGPPGEKI